jgi:hypothetical protein
LVTRKPPLMAKDRTLELKLIARDMLSDVVKGVEKSVGGLADSIKSAGTKAAGAWPTVAQGINKINDGFGTLKNVAGQALGALETGWNLLIEPGLEAQRVMAQTEAVIKSTGGAAGLTSDQIGDIAGAMSRLSGSEDEAIQSGENMLLTFTNIGSDVFPRVTQSMADMAISMAEGDVTSADFRGTAMQLGKALNDPEQGLTALSRAGVSFSDAQKEAIKQMMATNDVAGAQTLILAELEKEFGGAAKAAGDTLPGKMAKAKNAIDDFQKNISAVFIPVMGEAANTFNTLTTGNSQLADAFHASQQTIYNDLLAGKMSLEDYNNAITGMADNVVRWDGATGEALRTQSLMTAEQVQAAQAAREHEAALKAEQAAVQAFTLQTGTFVTNVAQQYLTTKGQMTDLAKRFETAERLAAEATRAQAAAAGEAILKNAGLAQSYKDASDAQATQMLAQAQLDTLKQKYDSGALSQEAFNRATDAVLLRYDLATPKSLAMADAQQKVNEAFLAGDLPLNAYILSSEKIPTIAADGKVTLEELTNLGIKPTTVAAGAQSIVVKNLKSAWDTIPTEVKTVYTIQTTGSAPAAVAGGSAPAAAAPTNRAGRGARDGMALGGFAPAGMPQWIGEHGREPFIPAVDGRVLSRRDAMDALSRGGQGAPTINVSIAATVGNGIDVEEMAYQVSEIIGARLKSYA